MDDEATPREELLRRFTQDYQLTQLPPRDLDLALTHRSYAYENGGGEDNERLEFLGDSVISTITSEFLYTNDPAADEGELSKIRARLVSRSLLGRQAQDIGLGPLMLLGRGERDSGGAQRCSTLGSALESLVGAIYLRLGFEAARDFVCRHILEDLVRIDEIEHSHEDYKSILQEWAQQHFKKVPTYRRVGEAGPDHDKTFFVAAMLGDEELARGSGVRVKLAENEAARLALEKIARDENQA